MQDNSLLQDTKTHIRCLLVSNPLNMTISNLCKDYIDLIGQPIPVGRLGYKSVIQLLWSIPDVVTVSCNNPAKAVLTPVVTQNLKSLDKLVVKQTVKTKTRNRNSRRRTAAPAQYKSSPNPYFVNPCMSSMNTQPNQSVFTSSSPHNNSVKNANTINVPLPKQAENSVSQTSEHEQHPRKLIQPDLSHHISNKIRRNLKDLIKSFPNGLNLSALAFHYEKYYNERLEYGDLGFVSALQFCLQLPDIFFVERPTTSGDFILFDAAEELPMYILEDLKAMENNKQSIKNKTNTVNSTKPEIYISDELAPDDMMGPDDSIEILWCKEKFIEGKNLNIVITETYDPTKFWFVLYDDQHFHKMNDMMDEMTKFYDETQRQYRIPSSLIQSNLYCAVYFAGSWQRAYITQPISEHKVKLFFVDYGTVSIVDTTCIRYLPKVYQELPQQAIRGRLDYIIPKNKSTYWDLNIIKKFIRDTKEQRLVAHLTEVEHESHVVWMVLSTYEKSKSKRNTCVSLNEQLVERGHAEICPVTYCSTKPGSGKNRWHMDYLWPLFHHLEDGVALSYSELLRLMQHGFTQETVLSEGIKVLKLMESVKMNVDFSENNDDKCGHFNKRSSFKHAENEDEIAFVDQLAEYCRNLNDIQNPEPEEKCAEESEESVEEFVRAYSIGGHDLHCVIVDYIFYIMTEEFLKKFLPFCNLERLHLVMYQKGVRCKHIKINLESHPETFRALQSANIPVVIGDESVIHLTPLRSLDLILYAFKIENESISKDINNILDTDV